MILLWACSTGPQRHVDVTQRFEDGDSATSEAPSDTESSSDDTSARAGDTQAATDTNTGLCPADMALVDGTCMDLYEAPNVAGALPLVMYTFDEAEAWCAARGRTLCLDTTWETACAGSAAASYPYGDTHQSGVCNDDETWLTYDQSKLSAWPASASATDVDNLEALLAKAGQTASASAEHVEALYQGEGSGENAGCVGEHGVFDLVGNVEEWTRRADGGSASFHGNLKGRYWAESRTCQSDVTVHGDSFRFYEIGFRCCAPPE